MYEFDIHNMTCGHCAGTVKKAIEQADPAASSIIDVGRKKVTVETSASPRQLLLPLQMTAIQRHTNPCEIAFSGRLSKASR